MRFKLTRNPQKTARFGVEYDPATQEFVIIYGDKLERLTNRIKAPAAYALDPYALNKVTLRFMKELSKGFIPSEHTGENLPKTRTRRLTREEREIRRDAILEQRAEARMS